MTLLAIDNLEKTYDGPVVRRVSLTLAKGEILSLLGPSGCGKTTLLRLIAGLERPDAGRVVFDGRDVTDLPPQRRNFGLMFQEFALFPHKSVFDNVAFGLQMQRQSSARVRERTDRMLDLVGLARLSGRNVADLSGGERQRVALARCLAPQPRLLMLDEPLGALDRALRERLLADIHLILKRLEITAIFVTHDQSEALAVSDRIAVMHAGALEQVDPPEILYRFPRRVFVARFLGFENLLAGTALPDGGIDTPLGHFHPKQPVEKMAPHQAVILVLRPEAAQLVAEAEGDSCLPRIAGQVVSRIFSGQRYRVGVSTGTEPTLYFDLPSETEPPRVGEPIALFLRPSGMAVIPHPPFGERAFDPDDQENG